MILIPREFSVNLWDPGIGRWKEEWGAAAGTERAMLYVFDKVSAVYDWISDTGHK
jgi:hypothetical protein